MVGLGTPLSAGAWAVSWVAEGQPLSGKAAASSDSFPHMTETTPDIAALRAAIAIVARGSNVIDRTLEVVSIVEAVSSPLGIHPVVVGGMAAYFWTATDELMTYDIDVVMDVPDELAERLAELGFDRSPDGRHWFLEGTDVFLEAPSARLDADAVITEITLRSGRTARIVSRVDILIDRLDEFQATGHEVPAQQALALLAGLGPDETENLDKRASIHGVSAILEAVRELADAIKAGGPPPDSGELHEIARAALRSDYPSSDP